MKDFTRLPDLASERLGGRAVAASDAFFAPAENLLRETAPVWKEDEYTDHGKWMDGWETRRRREPGHDWVVVRLGAPGVVHGVVVDTTHFRGNAPESVAVAACQLASEPGPAGWDAVEWTPVVERRPVEPDAVNPFAAGRPVRATHVRLAIHPDGGVARLRVHGVGAPDPDRLTGHTVDVAAIAHGGTVVACSDAFFGQPLRLLLPGPAEGMWDGWETRRRRGPGHDWVVVRLGARGRIVRVEVDTRHYRGNHPAACALELADRPEADLDQILSEEAWTEALPRSPLGPDAVHVFEPPDLAPAVATHARLAIHPDGGVARLRVWGEVA